MMSYAARQLTAPTTSSCSSHVRSSTASTAARRTCSGTLSDATSSANGRAFFFFGIALFIQHTQHESRPLQRFVAHVLGKVRGRLGTIAALRVEMRTLEAHVDERSEER